VSGDTAPTRPSVAAKRHRFRSLHTSGCFVMPNPWDVGSARWLQSLGFPALASTSSGFAWSCGRPDNAVDRDRVLAHLAALVDAADVPVNADFEGGFARDAEGVAANVRLAVETGVAGLSIEDSTGDPAAPLWPRDEAVARIAAARRAIDASGHDVLLVGRSEGFIAGRPDLEETIARLRAYAGAGADCLYAPGLHTREQVIAVVDAVAPKPVNLLVGGPSAWTVDDIAAMGVRRVSVGGALARAAWGGFLRAATTLARDGRFDGLADAVAGRTLNEGFAPAHPHPRPPAT
jgi:2-methylisocitrate lyase-like PEP mutase family enzyme